MKDKYSSEFKLPWFPKKRENLKIIIYMILGCQEKVFMTKIYLIDYMKIEGYRENAFDCV